jgi:hypothetical protein
MQNQNRRNLRTSGTLCIGVTLLFFFVSIYVHQRPSECPTPVSRLALLHSLAAGRLNIDAYREKTADVAEQNGHFYSDKAPGTVALSLPAFALSAIILKVVGCPIESDSGWLFSSWIACAGSISIVTAIGAGLLFAWLSNYVPPKVAVITVLAIFFGAAPLPYSTMMYSHAFVIGLISIAIWASSKKRDFRQHKKERPDIGIKFQKLVNVNRWDLVAGFCCGLALASEYGTALVIFAIFIWRAFQRPSGITPFVLGFLPPLFLIPLYSWVCFGKPFVLPYSLVQNFPEMARGFYGIEWPRIDNLYDMLFTFGVGLLFWSPFLIMAAVGYPRLARYDRELFYLTYLVPLLQILVISGRDWDWQGGACFGPRYLSPMLPLLSLPCALGLVRFPRAGAAIAAVSILLTTQATLIRACLQERGREYIVEFYVASYKSGQIEPNLGTIAGLSALRSIALFYVLLVTGVIWLMVQAHKLSAAAAGKMNRTDLP